MTTHEAKHLNYWSRFSKGRDEFSTYALIKGGIGWWHLKNFYEKEKERNNLSSAFLSSKSSQQKELQS